MIKKIKDLLSNFSNQDDSIEEEEISTLDKACSALLIEVAYADKIFDDSEITSLKESLKETYNLDNKIINDLRHKLIGTFITFWRAYIII